jgi:hypothetical protein
MSGRKRREVKKNEKAEEGMYKSAKRQRKQKQVAPSRSLSEAHGRVCDDAPTMEMKRRLRESSKGRTGGPGKKTKGMVVITWVQTESE